MPLLDIAAPNPSFPNHIPSHSLYHAYHPTLSYLWTSFHRLQNLHLPHYKTRCPALLIKAVATLEPKCSSDGNVRRVDYNTLRLNSSSETRPSLVHQSSSEPELDDREKLRRMRISKANKGNTPWNKGRKHSAETLQRISERTRLAMQDPKIKMKLANLGHAQSEETRIKIGVGVRMGWNKRREKLMLQETCHFEWQNLIADASRRGLAGEEELQWDSYAILDEQLEQEWLESIEQRKKTPRPQGSRRAPKSAEQRRKISESITAKWADPAYRDRVYSGLSKYHGTTVGVEKPRRSTSSGRQPGRANPVKKRGNLDSSVGNDAKSQTVRTKSKKRKAPLYKDPLASTKLELIKNIRAERENKKIEAVTRAKVLIAEAEKAAKALEVAAVCSPLAQASLVETRKLIAEAIKSIKSIETGGDNFDENGQNLPSLSVVGVNNAANKKINIACDGLISKDQTKVNGTRALTSYEGYNTSDMDFEKFNLQDFDIGSRWSKTGETIETSSALTGNVDQSAGNGSCRDQNVPSIGANLQLEEKGGKSKIKPMSKKWVRGKLVEVAEQD